MRKLLLLAVIFILCGNAFSQIYVPVTPTVYGIHQLRIKPDSAQHIPEKADSTKNTTDTSAQIYLRKADSSVWYYSKATGHRKLSVHGSSSTPSWMSTLNISPTATRTVKINDAKFWSYSAFLAIGQGIDTIYQEDVVLFGYEAGLGATGTQSMYIGNYAGVNNTGTDVTAVGPASGYDNTGQGLTAFGSESGQENSGFQTTALGTAAGKENSGDYVLGVGTRALSENIRDSITAIGFYAGFQNTYQNVSLFGHRAFADSARQFVVGDGMWRMRFDMGALTSDRKYRLQNTDGTIALTSNLGGFITGTLGSNQTVSLGSNSLSFTGSGYLSTQRLKISNIGAGDIELAGSHGNSDDGIASTGSGSAATWKTPTIPWSGSTATGNRGADMGGNRLDITGLPDAFIGSGGKGIEWSNDGKTRLGTTVGNNTNVEVDDDAGARTVTVNAENGLTYPKKVVVDIDLSGSDYTITKSGFYHITNATTNTLILPTFTGAWVTIANGDGGTVATLAGVTYYTKSDHNTTSSSVASKTTVSLIYDGTDWWEY